MNLLRLSPGLSGCYTLCSSSCSDCPIGVVACGIARGQGLFPWRTARNTLADRPRETAKTAIMRNFRGDSAIRNGV
jgi:hypothetical protein